MVETFRKPKYKDLHCFPKMDFKIGHWNSIHILVKLTLTKFIECLDVSGTFLVFGVNKSVKPLSLIKT